MYLYAPARLKILHGMRSKKAVCIWQARRAEQIESRGGSVRIATQTKTEGGRRAGFDGRGLAPAESHFDFVSQYCFCEADLHSARHVTLARGAGAGQIGARACMACAVTAEQRTACFAPLAGC